MEHLEQAKRVAALARLHLSAEELPRFAEQFQRILDYVSRIAEVDVEGVAPFVSAAAEGDWWRDDTPRPGLTPEEALANAPRQMDGFFRVPRIA